MKKNIFLLLSCMAMAACSNVKKSSNIATTQIVDNTAGSTATIRLYESLEELTNSSDLVAEIIIGDSKKLIRCLNWENTKLVIRNF